MRDPLGGLDIGEEVGAGLGADMNENEIYESVRADRGRPAPSPQTHGAQTDSWDDRGEPWHVEAHGASLRSRVWQL